MCIASWSAFCARLAFDFARARLVWRLTVEVAARVRVRLSFHAIFARPWRLAQTKAGSSAGFAFLNAAVAECAKRALGAGTANVLVNALVFVCVKLFPIDATAMRCALRLRAALASAERVAVGHGAAVFARSAVVRRHASLVVRWQAVLEVHVVGELFLAVCAPARGRGPGRGAGSAAAVGECARGTVFAGSAATRARHPRLAGALLAGFCVRRLHAVCIASWSAFCARLAFCFAFAWVVLHGRIALF